MARRLRRRLQGLPTRRHSHSGRGRFYPGCWRRGHRTRRDWMGSRTVLRAGRDAQSQADSSHAQQSEGNGRHRCKDAYACNEAKAQSRHVTVGTSMPDRPAAAGRSGGSAVVQATCLSCLSHLPSRRRIPLAPRRSSPACASDHTPERGRGTPDPVLGSSCTGHVGVGVGFN